MLIKDTNKVRIEKMIAEAEGRATTRTITYTDITKAILDLEKKLGITKKAMEGIVACVDVNAQDFCRAYKYTPHSTQIEVIRKASGWDLTKVYRDICNSPGAKYQVRLTDTAKDAIIKSHTRFA